MQIQKEYSKIWEKYGSFFAFGNERFKEQAKEGVQYVHVFGGLHTPKDTCGEMMEEMENVTKQARKAKKKAIHASPLAVACEDLEKANKNVIKRYRYSCGLQEGGDAKDACVTFFFQSPDRQNYELYKELVALGYLKHRLEAPYSWSVQKNDVRITYTEGDIHITLEK